MLNTKDKNRIKKLWDGKSKFSHKTNKEYSPFGYFHNLEGIETQITNGIRAGFETFPVRVLTHNDEGELSIVELTYDTNKKQFV